MSQFVISTQTRIDLEQEDEALLVNQDQHIKIALQLLMGYLKKTKNNISIIFTDHVGPKKNDPSNGL